MTAATIFALPWVSAASASTTSIGGLNSSFVNITGTTTITSFGSGRSGAVVFLRFDGALTLTHNGTSLILPTAANITTAAGDTAIAVCEGSSNWRVIQYQKANGGTVIQPASADQAALSGSLTNSTGAAPDTTIADVSAAVSGVDGTGSNAASKADVDARLVAINANCSDLAARIIAIETLLGAVRTGLVDARVIKGSA